MCGIIGFVSSDGLVNWQGKKSWVKKALFVDTMRGKDSTGIACIPEKAGDMPEVFKKAYAAPDFLQLKKAEDLLDNMDKYRGFIGHNRAATMGQVNHANAHPFQCGPITLVHNGTLWTRTGIPATPTVDSEAIAIEFSKREAHAVLEDLDGAFALVWHDNRDHTIHIARNKERPMSFAFSESKKHMFFASEGWMIKELIDIKIGKIYQLKVGMHVVIDPKLEDLTDYECLPFTPSDLGEPNFNWGRQRGKHQDYTSTTTTTGGKSPKEEAKERRRIMLSEKLNQFGYQWREPVLFTASYFEKFKQQPGSGMVKGYTVSSTGMYDEVLAYDVDTEICTPLDPDRILEGEAVGIKLVGTKAELTLDNVREYIPEPDSDDEEISTMVLVPGPHGSFVNEKEFNGLTKHGCVNCTGDVLFDDAITVTWTDDGRPICVDCVEGELDDKVINNDV